MPFFDRPVIIMAVLFAIAIVSSSFVYPFILKIAVTKQIVDNPNARKLQKRPIPVMGGIVVFFGIVISLCFFKTTVQYVNLFSTLCGMMAMLYLGSIDDILDVKAWKKFIAEIAICLLVIYGTRNLMMNFQGAFGVDRLPVLLSIPLTIIGMVGVINAINLIDGVDGLSSGMCIFIFACLAYVQFLAHEYSYCALAVICAGALIPFFIHNVFTEETKMYIGDGGTLMIGVAVASMIANILKGRGMVYTDRIPDFDRMSLCAMCLAIVSVPVFDTVRVMVMRIYGGSSPFRPDRTHLHHILMDYGFSPIATTSTEIFFDAAFVALWYLVFRLGAGVTWQLLAVLAAGILFMGASTFAGLRLKRRAK